eukprot:scaffold6.g2502.t1
MVRVELKILHVRSHVHTRSGAAECRAAPASHGSCLPTAEANSLVSSETEMPIDYYRLPFCKPEEGIKRSTNTVNPGTILLGIKIYNSPYNFTIMEKTEGQYVCKAAQYGSDHAYGPLSEGDAKRLKDRIFQQYRVRLILDNLPITTYDLELQPNYEQGSVLPGYELGYIRNQRFYVNNHLMFKILVHESNGQYSQLGGKKAEELAGMEVEGGRKLLQDVAVDAGGAAAPPAEKLYMIVGFEVVACSIAREPGKPLANTPCPQSPDDASAPPAQEVKAGSKIVYTYDVYWGTSDITWASRWDAYLRMPGGKVHWFSILNSLMVVMEPSAAAQADVEESGWKMVSGDIFRTPANPLGLCVQVGSGVQILASGFITLCFAALGFLSPASRGSLLTALLVMYLLLAVAAGYTAVWLWGLLNRSHDGWYKVCWRVACFFPGGTVSVLTVINMFLWATGSSGAIPLGFFFSIIFLWLIVSIPLSYAGGMVAARQEIRNYPVRTNQIPRHIPTPHWASHPAVLFFAAGLLPFGTIFVELYFAMTSMWQGYFYYIFGFAFLVALLTVIISIEVSIVCTYVQLCAEDYLWWWRSFHRGGSVALYVLLYSVGFLVNTLNSLTGVLPVVLYLSYMSLAVWCLWLAMGTIGFLSSFAFAWGIMAAAKSD